VNLSILPLTLIFIIFWGYELQNESIDENGCAVDNMTQGKK
jgi:hypothetical protein